MLRVARWLHRRLCSHEDFVVDCCEKRMMLRCPDCGRTWGPGAVFPEVGPDTDRAFAKATSNVRYADEN